MVPPHNPGPSAYSVPSLAQLQAGRARLSLAGGFSSSLVSQQHRARGLPAGKHSPGFRLKQQSGARKAVGSTLCFYSHHHSRLCRLEGEEAVWLLGVNRAVTWQRSPRFTPPGPQECGGRRPRKQPLKALRRRCRLQGPVGLSEHLFLLPVYPTGRVSLEPRNPCKKLEGPAAVG